jgi:hypothetical protein
MATPAPLPIIAGAYLARVVGSWQGLPSSNLFCFQASGVPLGSPLDAANAQFVSTTVAGNWNALSNVVFHTSYTATEVSTYALGSPLVPAQVAPTTAAGAATGLVAQASTAAFVKHTVQRRGRGSQSGTYFTPIAMSAITADGESLVGAAATALTTEYNLFIANVLAVLNGGSGGSPWTFVQMSKFHNKVPTPATYLITNSTADSRLSTQRRRTRR